MKHRLVVAVLFLLLAARSVGQGPLQTKDFVIYQEDNGCVAYNADRDTKFPSSTESSNGKSIYQVFWSATTPTQELFRVKVGKLVGQDPVKWWNYGICDEADFNRDGKPDYVWYGGDDTSFELYLFLSSGNRYQRIDVLSTVQAAWQRQFHTKAPSFAATGEYTLGDTKLERSPAGLALLATVEHRSVAGVAEGTFRFRIRQADFK